MSKKDKPISMGTDLEYFECIICKSDTPDKNGHTFVGKPQMKGASFKGVGDAEACPDCVEGRGEPVGDLDVLPDGEGWSVGIVAPGTGSGGTIYMCEKHRKQLNQALNKPTHISMSTKAASEEEE